MIAHQIRNAINAINYLMDATDQRVNNPLQIKEIVLSEFVGYCG